jgi:hypothetical protein
MNASFPMITSRMSCTVEQRVVTVVGERARPAAVVTGARREGGLKRFLGALLRSLSAMCA